MCIATLWRLTILLPHFQHPPRGYASQYYKQKRNDVVYVPFRITFALYLFMDYVLKFWGVSKYNK